MEHPERKPIIFFIVIGAIVALILGAGLISTYFGGEQAPLLPTLPDSPYGLTWKENQRLLVGETLTRPIRAEFSLLDARRETSTQSLALLVGILLVDPSTSTQPLCGWKLPINLRRVADEAGTLAVPKETHIEPPPTSCVGPGNPAFIGTKMVFPVPVSENEFVFTSVGSSDFFFSVSVSATGTIRVERAPQEIPG